MSRALLPITVLAGSVCSGCLVVPQTDTTTRRVGTEDAPATFVASREVAVETQLEGNVVHVQAKRIGDCTQRVLAIDEVTRQEHAHMWTPSDPRAGAFGLLLAPVTIPLSAIVTGFAVAGTSAKTTRTSHPIAMKKFACSLEADRLAITFTLASGARIERTTSRDGRIALEIPDTEPYVGTISIDAPTAPARQVAYAMPKPAVTALRDSVTDCAAQSGITGSITAKLSINDSGRATRLWLSAGGASMNACVARSIANLEFPPKTHGATLTMPLELTAMR